MKVFFLGQSNSKILKYINSLGGQIISSESHPETLKPMIDLFQPDYIVVHGYRHIIPVDMVNEYMGRMFNCHISYLPWNRGADPNFWSWAECTPKGVTIHEVAEGLDAGDILLQRELEFSDGETLRTSYNKLQDLLLELFVFFWEKTPPQFKRIPQPKEHTYHSTKDKKKFDYLLKESGWDTPVSVVESYCAETEMSEEFFDLYRREIEEMRKVKNRREKQVMSDTDTDHFRGR